jgi:DNA adenine methylase
MRYLGNKTRLAKYLIPIITKPLTGNNFYIEPFAGAFGMISNVKYEKRIAIDKDIYIIELIKAVRDGWVPPNITEKQYNQLKTLNEKSLALVGFAGYGCSFGGKWFGGFARGGNRNYVNESSRNLLKMKPSLQGIDIRTGSYKGIGNFKNAVIYCDPPYSTGTKYKMKFDHEQFWQWVREQSKLNYVYISEYNAPLDFKTVWAKQHKSGIHHGDKHKKLLEKLFVYENSKVMQDGYAT